MKKILLLLCLLLALVGCSTSKENTSKQEETKQEETTGNETQEETVTTFEVNSETINLTALAYQREFDDYSCYLIIDIDAGYVYQYYSSGFSISWVDKGKIKSGNMKDGLYVSYTEDGFTWDEMLINNQYDTDETIYDYIEKDYYEYTKTELEATAKLMEGKTIKE